MTAENPKENRIIDRVETLKYVPFSKSTISGEQEKGSIKSGDQNQKQVYVKKSTSGIAKTTEPTHLLGT